MSAAVLPGVKNLAVSGTPSLLSVVLTWTDPTPPSPLTLSSLTVYQFYAGDYNPIGGVSPGVQTKTITTNLVVGANLFYIVVLYSNGLIGMQAFVTAEVPYAPSVVTQPANSTITAGASTSFTAAANGYPGATVQWQSDNGTGGVTWTNLSNGGIYSGATTNSLALSSVPSGYANYQYRAVFTNSKGSATSNPAVLTITSGVMIWIDTSTMDWSDLTPMIWSGP